MQTSSHRFEFNASKTLLSTVLARFRCELTQHPAEKIIFVASFGNLIIRLAVSLLPRLKSLRCKPSPRSLRIELFWRPIKPKTSRSTLPLLPLFPKWQRKKCPYWSHEQPIFRAFLREKTNRLLSSPYKSDHPSIV